MSESPKGEPLTPDVVGLMEGIATTRAIRRYRPEPIPTRALRDILFAATRAPSGSNRQPFRFLVMRDGPTATEARALLADSARRLWSAKAERDGYRRNMDSPKSRVGSVMDNYVENIASAPVIIFPCLVRYRSPVLSEGASIYPASQNLLLAARALGYGGVLTGLQQLVEDELRQILAIPDEAAIAGTITLGRPVGRHGPVRRRPMKELVFDGGWGVSAGWAEDPVGTRFAGSWSPTSSER